MGQATATRSIKVSEDAHRALKIEAAKRGCSLIELVDRLTSDRLGEVGREGRRRSSSPSPSGPASAKSRKRASA